MNIELTGRKVCFIGHRKVDEKEIVRERLLKVLLSLVEEMGIRIFLFGSKSQFDSLCHSVVTEIKENFPDIQRISYTCRSEAIVLEEDREATEKSWSKLIGREIFLQGFEGEVEHKTKYTAGKASYVERNQAMINDSDICIFYCNEKYLPPKRKYSKRDICEYQPKSGTKIAYDYALQKQKKIINIHVNI